MKAKRSVYETTRDRSVIESMMPFETLYFRVRIWRNEDELKETYDNLDIDTFLNDNYACGEKVSLIEVLCGFDRVNAVEILDKTTKTGIVKYNNWP